MAQLRILSRSSAPFTNREEAGKLLGRELSEYRGQNVVVLGIPRGGIVLAREIARALGADIDIVLAHKLGTPGHQELAMGSVSEDGRLFLNQGVVREFDVGESYIQQEKARQIAEIKRRTDLIRRIKPKIPLQGKIVIVTDDGVATGATTQAAFWAVRLEQPKKLIAAMPVGPEDTIRRLAEDVDEMLCLRVPPLFAAVGQFYQQFDPVEDEEVLRILRDSQKK
ncbi:MAG: phosphoribosyltransferase family protein [Dehalococcoidales bacterium]|nr:phosphoribosyltransferase family protein [Dehalococcoidales bacterium]